MVTSKFPRELVFEPRQLTAVEKIRGRIIAQQNTKHAAFLDLFQITLKQALLITSHMLQLKVLVDFAHQPRCILANTPANITLPAEVGRDLNIVAVTLVNFYQVAVENSRVDFPCDEPVEYLFV